MVGMAFSIGSFFRPALPKPRRSVFIGVDPVITMLLTAEVTATPDATVVSPADVVAVPPVLKFVASAKENKPVGVGDDAAARPIAVDPLRASILTFTFR